MATTDLDAFRSELRTWLAANVPHDLRPEHAAHLSDDERVRKLRAWQRKLAENRWLAIAWPEEHGGRGAGIAEQIVYVEEMARADAPEIIGNLGLNMAGPALIAFGTDEQKRRFLPRILRCDDLWAFGLSEPGAGSDLASLRTQAVVEGDEFVLTGQKVWTTYAHIADWIMVLCRTDPGTKRAKGISCLMVDLRSPGVEVRPLRQLTGEAEFNEVFFDHVRVPKTNLVGTLHEGWQVATALLQNERGILYVVGMQVALQEGRDRLLALARSRGAGTNPLVRQQLADLHTGVEAFRATCRRTLDKLLRFGFPGPESAIIKLHWTELTQKMPLIGMEIIGSDGLLYDTPPMRSGQRNPAQWVQGGYLMSRAASIASGTSEIMRGIIAMQVLGLPRGQ